MKIWFRFSISRATTLFRLLILFLVYGGNSTLVAHHAGNHTTATSSDFNPIEENLTFVAHLIGNPFRACSNSTGTSANGNVNQFAQLEVILPLPRENRASLFNLLT